MTNFKALGIEKDMTTLFNSLEASDLNLLEESSYFDHPSISARQQTSFCDIIVTDCQHKDWWYKNLIGMKFTCEINFTHCRHSNTKYISRLVGAKVTNTKIIRFRDFDPKDVSII
jgi:hypothetical protein